jgi:hypothetical protein
VAKSAFNKAKQRLSLVMHGPEPGIHVFVASRKLDRLNIADGVLPRLFKQTG